MPIDQISEQGRATQGVKLIRLDDGDDIAAITNLNDRQEEEEESPEQGNENPTITPDQNES